LDGSLPELVKEISTKSDPDGTKFLVESLGLLARELTAAIGDNEDAPQAEAAETAPKTGP
jgi:hypothetical protein